MISTSPIRTLKCRGATAVEFALVCAFLFAFVFGTLEAARAMYLWSTLAEVVGRAARLAAIADPQNLAQVRHQAMFSSADGKLPLGGAISEDYLKIDYLARDRTTVVTPPPCPIDNIINCIKDPLGASCVRFVRVQLCQPGGTGCTQLTYNPVFNLDFMQALRVTMPTFATVAPVESLGLPGACPH